MACHCIVIAVHKFVNRHWANLSALGFMMSTLVLTTLVTTLNHERTQLTSPRLPDLVLDFIPSLYRTPFTDFMYLTEMYLTLQTTTFVILIILHQEREMISRRFMLLNGILYLIRAAAFTATSLPPPPPHALEKYCSTPKLNDDTHFLEYAGLVMLRAFKLLYSMGMVNQNGIHICGDCFYSGHTLIILLVHLFIETYFISDHIQGRNIFFFMSKLHWLLSFTAVVGILLSQHHYTIDVLGSYFVVTICFRLYHSMCLNQQIYASLQGNAYYDEQLELLFASQSMPSGRYLPQIFLFHQCLMRRPWWWPMFVAFELNNRPEIKTRRWLDVFPIERDDE